MSSVVLKLDQINYDGSTQSRVRLDESVVTEYANALTDGAKLPPIVVFHDGTDRWLADGFHRFHAHRRIGAYEIDAEVRQGTRRDAVLFSVGANASHGLRRTNDDKRKAVLTLLADSEWAKWSDNQVAKACGVSHPFVGQVRRSLETVSSEARTYTTKHGTTAVMKTANIGNKEEGKGTPAAHKKPARTIESQPLPEEQATSADELAEAHHTISDLAAENEKLMDRLAVGALDASEDEKTLAAETIAELRQRVHVLEQENDALKSSRDTYMHQLSEMKKQVNYWRKKAEKVAA